MTGGGNDFVLFDNRKKVLTLNYSALAKKVCDRKFSVGADGLLVLENVENAHFRMVYYNSDGSRAEMCGNGARCISRFAYLLNAAPDKLQFITDAGPMSAEIMGETVKIKMSAPKDLKLDIALKFPDGKELQCSHMNTGVPHAIVYVTDIDKINPNELGPKIRHHKEFGPNGANANFVFHKDKHSLTVRTYERGVEAETLACGTGAVASSLISGAKSLVKSPVSCLTRGGETLKVYFKMNEDKTFEEVYLEGPATVCFKGEIENV
jgi:diaminopimelate epimerase